MSDFTNTGPRRRGTTMSGGVVNNHNNNADTNGRAHGATRPATSAGPREPFRAPSSIRIRRLPSNTVLPTARPISRQSHASSEASDVILSDDEGAATGRRRSFSAPQRYVDDLSQTSGDLTRMRTPDPHMETIAEGRTMNPNAVARQAHNSGAVSPLASPGQRQSWLSSRFGSPSPGAIESGHAQPRPRRTNTRNRRSQTLDTAGRGEYDSDVIDLLDLIDPEVRTIGTLTNVQNSLFVPDLGGLVNRRPTYDLTPRPSHTEFIPPPRPRADTWQSGRRKEVNRSSDVPLTEDRGDDGIEMQPPRRTISIDSRMSESRYAVLPHGISLDNWTDEDIEELNDHVRHLLHSRREGFKRGWRGFKKYVSQPLGLFVTVYATLVTLFGAAWVFCLIGWIYVGSRQDYFINVIDEVLVALFALIGDGLAPFRAVDTYHMCFIAHYHHLTWRLRRERALPELVDENDLPDRARSPEAIADAIDKAETSEVSVLNPRQQARLRYHQAKFSKSHTFYKPHETATHHAFPLRFLVAVVVLLDCHSLFQVALGTCTWSIEYTVRPRALTATILSLSISCNIAAGVLISIGDHRTRKKQVLERIFRQGLTEEAIRAMQKRRSDNARVSLDLDAIVDENADGSAPPAQPAKLALRNSPSAKDPTKRIQARQEEAFEN